MRTDNPIRQKLKHLRAVCGLVALGLLAFSASNQATAADWTGIDLGFPGYAGSATDNGDGTTTIKAGGADIWGTSDNGYYYYQPVSGPVWDAVVRVRSLECPGSGSTGNAQWAKCELMVRMDQGTGYPEGSDAFIASMTTMPSTYQTAALDYGVNWVVDQFRTVASGNADWIYNTQWSTVSHVYNAAGNPAPNYPDRWLRLTRTGSVFTVMDSTDGVNWDTSAVIDTSDPNAQPAGNDNGTRFTTPFTGNLFIGVAVTSHDNAVDDSNCATAIISDLTLTVQTDLLFVDNPVGLPVGFDMSVIQSGAAILDQASVKLTLDGAPVTATSTKTSGDGSTITFRYANIANPLVSGSTHTVKLECKDTRGVAAEKTANFTVPTYATVPADYATTTYSTPGMAVNVHQIEGVRGPDDGNFTKNAETQLADGFIDPTTGQPYANTADMTLATMGQFFVDFVNWDQYGTDIDATPEDGPDHFNSSLPTWDNAIPNAPIPGIPGLATAYDDNIVAMITTYLDLKRGWYKMGVNSDDGFKVSMGPGAPDAYGLTLGQFNGGRGASDTVFDFFVQQDGVYPTRLLWWEGNGGANVEWFSVDTDTGERTLVGYNSAAAIKAYRAGQGRAFIKSLIPYPAKVVQQVKPTIKGVLVDGRTTVVNGSIQLTVDGATVTPTINKVGGTTTVTYQFPNPLAFESAHQHVLTYQESTTPVTTRTITSDWTVKGMGVDDMPPAPPSFVIEAEDFDFDGGQTMAEASIMPYYGGAYRDLGAVLNVDFYNNDGDDSQAYRTPLMPGNGNNVDMDTQMGAGTLDVLRPGYEVTANCKIGWADSADWYCYTRDIPAGLYTAFSAQSIDPAQTVTMTLSQVTEGAGTTTQTLRELAVCQGVPPGGWGNNGLLPAKNPDGSTRAFRLPGGEVTLRVDIENGDYDWFVLVPVSNVKPRIDFLVVDTVKRNEVVLNWQVVDMSTSAKPDTIKVEVDGNNVTAKCTKTANVDGTAVKLDDTGTMYTRGTHSWTVSFQDTGNATISSSGTFIVNPYPTEGIFVIEAEDFNYEGGKTNPKKGQAGLDVDVMPYLGNAYAGLDAINGVDYNSSDGRDAQEYRAPLNVAPHQNVQISRSEWDRYCMDRGVWNVTANFKIGWAGGGKWQNFTRTFPANDYEVWAALAYDGRGAGQLHGYLDMVTSDPATTGQTVSRLGVFDAPGSGGWGRNELVPMKDAAGGTIKTVSLGGVQTVRFWDEVGDFDYLVLVPLGVAQPPKFTAWRINTDGTMTLEWTGGGTLQAAPTVLGPWQDVTGATSPYTFAPTGNMLFGRIKK